MADKKYLDENGLIRFAAHLIDKFAMKTHSHDDVYYTETEIDTKVAELQAGIDGHTHSWNDLEDKPFGSVSTEIPLIEIENADITYAVGPISDYDIKPGDPVRVHMIINSEEVVMDSIWEGVDGDDGFIVEDYEAGINFRISPAFSSMYQIVWIENGPEDVRVDSGTTMRIYALSEGVTTIDPKFLPDTVAMKSEVDASLATKADKTHTHAIADVTNLQTTLDSLQSSIDSVDGAVDNIASGTVVVKEAEHAESADSAATATKADTATTATTATNATTATTAGSATKATQDASGNVITSTYETKVDATAKLDEAKDYADTVASGKADASHTHTIANVTNLQSTLDSKFDKAGGTVTGATTFNSTVTIGSATLSYDTTEDALVISFA